LAGVPILRHLSVTLFPMNFPHHLLRLLVGQSQNVTENNHVALRTDVQWGSPVFRAPGLPTPNQMSRELPFTEDLRPLFGRRH
jgi:hypothetical protein